MRFGVWLGAVLMVAGLIYLLSAVNSLDNGNYPQAARNALHMVWYMLALIAHTIVVFGREIIRLLAD